MAYPVGRVVGKQAAGELPALRVELVDQVLHDLDLAVVDVILPGQTLVVIVDLARGQSLVRARERKIEVGLRLPSLRHLDHLPLSVDDVVLLVQGDAVEVGVCELLGGGARVVDDVERELAVVGSQSRAASDDLLELGHRADDPGQHDVLARWSVDAGGQQVRGGQDDGRSRLHVLEPGPVSVADMTLVRSDPAHIVGVFLDQIGVELGERAAHLQCVLLADAEDDRLRETVGLAHEAGEVPGDGPGPRPDRDQTLEVRGVVLGVRDRSSVPVDLALARAPSGGIVVGDDTMHAEGGEKPVLDALGKAVFIDRIAEIRVGIDVVLAARRSCRPGLRARTTPGSRASCHRRGRCPDGTRRR